ncbi:MAG: bifunctional 4-hydroxy-2-oxoglutarate aldolase/2-dehydro-3-deoxy-phosphogluconate aldolase [Marmoricola sp.]
MSATREGSLLDLSPVIPVVVLHHVADAVPLALALVRGGIGVIELTLRTPAALDGVRAIAAEVPDIVVGAGTITSPALAEAAARSGARFLVSPGTTPALLDAMRSTGLPVLPGVSTVSEALRLLEAGIEELKFFPAEACGGAGFLRSLASPLPAARFCPTGGISAAAAPGYLALPNVGCVGGTWVASPSLLAAHDWAGVEQVAREATSLRVPAPA